jgi:hypothetical protein
LRLILTLCLLASLPLMAAAQLISNPNYPSAAAQAVGGAYTAAASGADAVYWNPAGLAYGSGTEGRFVYQRPWNLGFLTHLSAVGFTVLSPRAGGLAVSVQSLATRADGSTLASENEIALSHGLLLQHDIHSSLAFGYSLKVITYNLGESVTTTDGASEDLGSAAVAGLDVGATAQLWDRFKLGGAFKNINHPQLGQEEFKRDLPRIFAGGLSYFPYYGVRVTFDVERQLDSETQFKGGVNATVAEPLDLRFGVLTNPNMFTAGFGFHWRQLVLDYAFIYHPILEPSHLIGIGFNLNQSLADLWRTK